MLFSLSFCHVLPSFCFSVYLLLACECASACSVLLFFLPFFLPSSFHVCQWHFWSARIFGIFYSCRDTLQCWLTFGEWQNKITWWQKEMCMCVRLIGDAQWVVERKKERERGKNQRQTIRTREKKTENEKVTRHPLETEEKRAGLWNRFSCINTMCQTERKKERKQSRCLRTETGQKNDNMPLEFWSLKDDLVCWVSASLLVSSSQTTCMQSKKNQKKHSIESNGPSDCGRGILRRLCGKKKVINQQTIRTSKSVSMPPRLGSTFLVYWEDEGNVYLGRQVGGSVSRQTKGAARGSKKHRGRERKKRHFVPWCMLPHLPACLPACLLVSLSPRSNVRFVENEKKRKQLRQKNKGQAFMVLASTDEKVRAPVLDWMSVCRSLLCVCAQTVSTLLSHPLIHSSTCSRSQLELSISGWETEFALHAPSAGSLHCRPFPWMNESRPHRSWSRSLSFSLWWNWRKRKGTTRNEAPSGDGFHLTELSDKLTDDKWYWLLVLLTLWWGCPN